MNTRSMQQTMMTNPVAHAMGGAAIGLLGAYYLNRLMTHPYNYKSNISNSSFLPSLIYYLYCQSDPVKKTIMTLLGAYIAFKASKLRESKDINLSLIQQKLINYSTWEKILKDERLPAAIIDLDAFDRNLAKLADTVSSTDKTIRIATKSIRIPDLILRVLAAGPSFRGLMCYSAEEALFLHKLGMNDLLIAYPTIQSSDLQILKSMQDKGVKISLVVDSLDQIKLVAKAMQGVREPFSVLVEMDMSLRLFAGLIHLGVRRSPIRTLEDLQTILEDSRNYPSIKVIGIMAYEAAVAGLTDMNPSNKILNPLATLVRKMSQSYVEKMRAQIPEIFKKVGLKLEIFNGGGTGSINYAVKEKALTEVTVGSGLLCPQLFDYYSNLQKTLRFEPAAYFALQTVRSSDKGYITCSGGGYVASGEPGWDRLPTPISPQGLQLLSTEGCGEVQTPLEVKGSITPVLGGPTLFRPAKAGELAERFNEYLIVSKEEITGHAKTYRGLGKCFL